MKNSSVKRVVYNLLEYVCDDDNCEDDTPTKEVASVTPLNTLPPEVQKLKRTSDDLSCSSSELNHLIHTVEDSLSSLLQFKFPDVGGELAVKRKLRQAISEFKDSFKNVKSSSSSLVLDWANRGKELERQIYEM